VTPSQAAHIRQLTRVQPSRSAGRKGCDRFAGSQDRGPFLSQPIQCGQLAYRPASCTDRRGSRDALDSDQRAASDVGHEVSVANMCELRTITHSDRKSDYMLLTTERFADVDSAMPREYSISPTCQLLLLEHAMHNMTKLRHCDTRAPTRQLSPTVSGIRHS
jgi:hypothetical protein